MEESRLTDTVLMIRPHSFRGNEETAVNNHFQNENGDSDSQEKAVEEFDGLVSAMRNVDIRVLVMLDNDEYDTPDSIFPNNWVSFHEDDKVGIYPMFAENRRLERRDDLFDFLDIQGIAIGKKIDLTHWEEQDKFLEGTGSLVLDRESKVAYACISERTHVEVLQDFEAKFGYTIVTFHAFHSVGSERKPIYHTNVMMCMGDSFTVICLDTIDDDLEKHELILSLTTTGKEVIEISEEQMESFAGNMLQLKSQDAKKFMIMSESARNSLAQDQVEELLKYNDDIISSPLDTIESLGGGSARCMIAEIF